MGAWGNGIFESDNAYDAIDEIEAVAGLDLYFANETDRATMRDKLNAGLFDTLWTHPHCDIVYVAALAMLNGATILPEYREAVLDSLAFSSGFKRARKQMWDGLAIYVDGVEHKFENKGLLATVLEHAEAGGDGLVNVAQIDEEDEEEDEDGEDDV
jgi:hypothetical protein